MILALLYRSIPAKSRLWNSGARFYGPGIAVIVLVLANGDRIPYPVVHNGLLAPAYATIMFGLALEGGILVRFLSMPALLFLGNASYSMYILHAPIGAWMNIGFRRVLHIAPYGPFWLICYVAAVIGFASVFFWKAEEPAHRWLRRRPQPVWAEGRGTKSFMSHTTGYSLNPHKLLDPTTSRFRRDHSPAVSDAANSWRRIWAYRLAFR